MQMNDLIIKESFDLNEDNEGSYNNKTSNKNINLDRTANKKKMRRSRIIMSENNDNSMDFRREIYDPETKYLKSIISAKNYNEMLSETRNTISKHFLKRKVKAAFEREPLEKNKSFFNIPFLPNANMFAAPPQTQPAANVAPPQQGQMRPSAHNPVQHPHGNKPDMRNITMNRPSDSNIANSLTISNNAKLSQIAAHNKLNENFIGNVSQKPSLNSILNTNTSITPSNNINIQNPLAQPTVQKITSNTNLSTNTFQNTTEEKLNLSINNNIQKNPNTNNALNLSGKTITNTNNNSNLNLNSDLHNKSTATKTSIGASQLMTSPIKQIGIKIASSSLKAQENSMISSYNTNQISVANSISANVNVNNENYNNNISVNLLPQRSLSGKFNIVSGVNSATQSSTNVNNLTIPSNTLSSSNLNLTGKSAPAQSEAAAKPKNDEFISYDTESNDSSPRSNLQPNNVNNNSALNSQKNLNGNNSNFSVAYSAAQLKAAAGEGNNNNNISNSNVNNANSAFSGQAKSLKVCFPIAGGMEEKASTTAFSQQEISMMQNASLMSSKSKQNIIFTKNLSGTSNLPNNNIAGSTQQQENVNSTANPNIPIDNISDILNGNNSLREKLLKQIVEIYKNNPDKLMNDLGPTDFAKIQNVINSTPKAGSAGANIPNTNTANDALKLSATSITSPNQTSNTSTNQASNQISTKLSSQKITFPSSTLTSTGSREENMLFSSAASAGSSSQNLIIKGVSTNTKKISFDLKNQTSLTLNSNSSSSAATNSANTNNTLKTGGNGTAMPFMNFNSSAASSSSNKILLGNSAASADSSIHKQLNYQILKTISNKNNAGAASNILSPNSGVNNLNNGVSLYSNMQGFKGPTNLTGNSSSSSNMSNVFLNTITQKNNPKSSDLESSSNPSHTFKEEQSIIQISVVQENSLDEGNVEENQGNLVKESDNVNE